MTIDTNPQRLIGAQRKLAVLYFLARAGYATSRQLAYFCTGSTSKAKTNMLNRTLARMQAAGLIHERFDRLRTERFVALTAAGAQLAAAEIPALQGVAPKVRDNLRHVNAHRTACNGVLAYYLRKYPPEQGHMVQSELEIASDKTQGRMQFWSEADHATLTKVADCIVRVRRDNEWQTYWLEMENCYRSPRDLLRLVAWCRQWYRDGFRFRALVLMVGTPAAHSIGDRLLRALQQAATHDYELREQLPNIIQRLQVVEFDAASNEVKSTQSS